jgi:hypothetical protein
VIGRRPAGWMSSVCHSAAVKQGLFSDEKSLKSPSIISMNPAISLMDKFRSAVLAKGIRNGYS